MQPHLQRIERQGLAEGDRKLAVEHELFVRQPGQHGDDLGEIAPQRLARLGAQIHLVAGAEGEAAKPVPLRLELPVRLARQLIDELRLHRLGVERDGQVGKAPGAQFLHETETRKGAGLVPSPAARPH